MWSTKDRCEIESTHVVYSPLLSSPNPLVRGDSKINSGQHGTGQRGVLLWRLSVCLFIFILLSLDRSISAMRWNNNAFDCHWRCTSPVLRGFAEFSGAGNIGEGRFKGCPVAFYFLFFLNIFLLRNGNFKREREKHNRRVTRYGKTK